MCVGRKHILGKAMVNKVTAKNDHIRRAAGDVYDG